MSGLAVTQPEISSWGWGGGGELLIEIVNGRTYLNHWLIEQPF